MPSSRKIRSKDFCTSTPLGWVVACGVKAKLILPLGLLKSTQLQTGTRLRLGPGCPASFAPMGPFSAIQCSSHEPHVATSTTRKQNLKLYLILMNLN